MSRPLPSYGPSGVPGWSGTPTGKQLLSATWGLLKQDRELFILPVLGTVFGVIAGVVLFVPGFALGYAVTGDLEHQLPYVVGGFLFTLGATFAAIFFQAALVIGAMQRADGGDPTLSGVLGAAWRLKGKIFGWALLTTIVGTALRVAEERLGFLGKVVSFVGGLAWAIASFLAVPVLVAEGLGPIDAVKRSGQLIKATWGTSLRTTLRFSVIQFLLFLPVLAVGVVGVLLIASGSGTGIGLGAVLLALAVIGIIALAITFSAVTTYARALIYRYATGLPTPGIDAGLFAGAFRPKGRKRFA